MRRATLLLTGLALAAASCGDGGPAAGPGATPSGPAEIVLAYYAVTVDDRSFVTPERRPVPAGGDIPRLAAEEVVTGDPQDPDHRSPFPDDARVQGVTVADGTATVDWNAALLDNPDASESDEIVAIQSMVWTLTELEGIERVRFTVEGRPPDAALARFWGHDGLADQPLTREEDFILAPIVVWAPADGATVGNEIAVEGEASVFEGTVGIRVIDAGGEVAVSTTTTATEGGPSRGTFSARIAIPTPLPEPQEWRLEVFESSPEDDAADFFVETRTIRVG